MLEPHPKVVRTLLARYAEARFAHAHAEDARTARVLADVAYTLCVTTGTATVEDAITAADVLLERSRSGHAAPDDNGAAGGRARADLAA
ncbi:DUF5133 domain-containing protein [Streptomyces sp. NPDC048448]|uniref:DUF5133 domain-containing protein n=1 Tax=Streptomyces kaempferi TaxID=333725 RepID=A0ABW3XXQ9_9ACTN|nr:DUF5133 domain-containing protein [Streptomyces sp. RPA4-2]QIY65753.1 DUF5133 domain-containing protein [Streptomyces sp. RPA4-2]